MEENMTKNNEVIDADFKEVSVEETNSTNDKIDVPNLNVDNATETTEDHTNVGATILPSNGLPNFLNEASITHDDAPIEEKTEQEIYIKTAVPYTMIFSERDEKDIATVVYLCRDINDKLIVLDRNIVLKPDQREDLELIPFAQIDEEDFINKKICSNAIMGYLDNYICTMEFKVDEDYKKSDAPFVYTEIINVKTRETKKAKMTANTFSAIAFIDNYIIEDIVNEHDLSIATVKGSTDDNAVKFFVVENIESIVAMAPAEVDKSDSLFAKVKNMFKKKESHPTSIGIVTKVSRSVGDEKEIVNLLTPFDIGVEFNEDKFRGNTIKSIEESYYGDGDQYVSLYTINSIKLFGIDKTYMIIRAKTKTGENRLFCLDYSVQKELQDKINEY